MRYLLKQHTLYVAIFHQGPSVYYGYTWATQKVAFIEKYRPQKAVFVKVNRSRRNFL